MLRYISHQLKWSELREHFLLNMNDPRNYGFYGSIEAMKNDQQRQLSHYKYRIHPHSRFRVLWDTFYCGFIVVNVLFCCVYFCLLNLTYVPRTRTLFVMLMMSDAVLLANILLNFITGTFQDGKQDVVMSLPGILWRYFRCSFAIDVIGLVGGSPLIRYANVYHKISTYKWSPLFLIEVISVGCRIHSSWRYWRSTVERYFLIDGLKSSLVQTLVYFPLLNALIALFGFVEYHRNDEVEDSKDTLEILHDLITYANKLLTGFSNSAYLNSPGMVMSDIFYSIIFYVVYVAMSSFLILIFLSRWHSYEKYVDLHQSLNQYLQQVHISERLKIRIIRYYEEIYHGRYYNEFQLLENMSTELREEFLSFKLSRLREEITILRMLPINELLLVGKHLVKEVYFGNDVIAYSGTPHDRMYFVVRGSVAVYTDNAYEIFHIPNAVHFLRSGVQRDQPPIRLNYLASETTILYSLSRPDYLYLEPHCPVFTELLIFASTIMSDVNEFIQEKDREANAQFNV